MYSYDPVALFYLLRNDAKSQDSEKDDVAREKSQNKEREWQHKWYNRNNNGIEID